MVSMSDHSYCLLSVPDEVTSLVLSYLPLRDLANVRLVSSPMLAWLTGIII